MAVIISYLIMSPDKATLALTRGAAGAAKGAASIPWNRSPATESAYRSGRSTQGHKKNIKNAKKIAKKSQHKEDEEQVGPALSWPRIRAAAAGWKTATSAAKAKREARADAFSAVTRAGGALVTAAVAGRAADGRIPDRLRASLAAGRVKWTGQEIASPMEDPDASSDQAPADPGGTDLVDSEPSETPTKQTADAAPEPHDVRATSPEQIPASAGTTTPGEMLMKTTELDSLTAVQSEAQAAQALCEALSEQIAQLKTWAAKLPERWSDTNWATSALNSSVESVAAASEQLGGADSISEALGQVNVACEKAKTVAEVADAVGATGDIGAFRAA
ncbi:MAG: hypothetical protein ACRC0L_13100 [Angustibacter sp.]